VHRLTPVTALTTYGKESSRAAKRIASVDIFRGLNVLLMIFVNNLSEVKDCPGGPITVAT
jgi:hypothetical protein